MSTPAQIAANRANALKSTGPTSPEGKARSAMNALQSGLDAQSLIIPGESPEAFAQLKDEYYSRYSPTDPEQRFYLDTALRHDWLLRRFHKVEEQLWALAGKRLENPFTGLELGQVFDHDNPAMMRLHRRIAHSEKAYDRAMQTFHRLQAIEKNPQIAELASFRTSPRAQRATILQPLAPGPRPPVSGPRPPFAPPRDSFLDSMEAQIRERFAARGVDYDDFVAANTPTSE